ncbi:MAG: hypothetical protein M0Z27_04315 [Thermaerobacter sp.]|nr:hypothetical protein [Thermaerobacter sp.]
MQPLRPLDLAGILDSAFSLFWRHAWFLMGLGLCCLGPIAVLSVLLGSPAVPTLLLMHPLRQVILILVEVLAQFTALLATVRAAGVLYRGETAEFWPCLAPALLRVVPYTLLALVLYGLIGIASVLLVVPGLLVAALFFLFVPALMLENRGFFAALDRGVNLAVGALPRLVGVMFLSFCMRYSGTLLLFLLVLLPFLLVGSARSQLAPALTALLLLVQIPLLAFQASVAVVAYYDRRAVREGLDLEDRLTALEAAP